MQIPWQALGRRVLWAPRLYEVGHHGSHDATLGERGLELMTSPELRAVIPLDRATAEKQRWDMPYEKLHERLEARTSGRTSITDDADPPPFAARHAELYVDLEFAPAPDPAP